MDDREREIRAALRALAAASRDEGKFRAVVALAEEEGPLYDLSLADARAHAASSQRLARAHRDELLKLLG